MADNRMYIREKFTGKSICIAKYSPASGWYRLYIDLDYWFMDVRKELCDMVADTKFPDGFSPYGSFGTTSFELVYETAEDETKEI